MNTQVSHIIAPIDSINPSRDHYWVPDGEDMWFLPCVLDFINNTYSGYWYGIKHEIEDEHHHSGVAQGMVLHGEMILKCSNEKSMLKPQGAFLLPPKTIHSADMIPAENGFLMFGFIVGITYYINSGLKLDVSSYYDMICEHYTKHALSLERIAINKSV